MSSNSSTSSSDEGERSLNPRSSTSSHSPSPSLSPFNPPQQLLDEYQALLSQTIDIPSLTLSGLLPTQPQSSQHEDAEDEDGENGKPMTKAEKQNAKKRRRKEREREARLLDQAGTKPATREDNTEDKGVGFRLFSSCPIRNIRLERELEDYACPANPRHTLLTNADIALRRTRAEASAVNYPNLGGPSILAERWSRTSHYPRSFTAPQHFDPDNLIHLEIDENYRSTNSIASATSKASRPIPILEVHTSSKTTRPMRRSRKGSRSRPRPEAAYWRPSDDLGGKSQSTLWGYTLGMPVRPRR